MTLKKIHWPDYRWQKHSRLDPELHEVDHALVKWAVWFKLYAKHRGLSTTQLYGLGMMAGPSARARWIPKQQQWVDLAIAALHRSHSLLARIIWEQYMVDSTRTQKLEAMAMSNQGYAAILRSARSSVDCALTLMSSKDLTERALYVRDKREKQK